MDSVLANSALGRRVAGQRLLHQVNEFLSRPIDSHARSVEVFVQRCNHHRLACREVFPDFDGASVAGERVLLVPRQHAYVYVAVIAGKVGIRLLAEQMDIGPGRLEKVRFSAYEDPVPIGPQFRHALDQGDIHGVKVGGAYIPEHWPRNFGDIRRGLGRQVGEALEVHRLFQKIPVRDFGLFKKLSAGIHDYRGHLLQAGIHVADNGVRQGAVFVAIVFVRDLIDQQLAPERTDDVSSGGYGHPDDRIA